MSPGERERGFKTQQTEVPPPEVKNTGEGEEKEKKEKTDLRQSLRQIIEKVYKGEEKFSSSFFGSGQTSTQFKIAELAGQTKSFEERKITREYSRAVSIFLEELIVFVKDVSRKRGEEEKLQSFIQQTDEDLFGYSPNIANEAGLENLINLGVVATRVPEVQAWFGGKITGEIVYELAFCSERIVDEVVEKIKNKPVAETVDFLNYLTALGAHSLANGSWAERAHDKIKRILREVAKIENCPFVAYARRLSQKRLEEEEENPSVGFVHFAGDKSQGRLHEISTEELLRGSDVLFGGIKPDIKLASDDKLLQISKDAVIVLDHSNVGRSYAYHHVDQKQNQNEAQKGGLIRAVEEVKDFLEYIKGFPPDQNRTNKLKIFVQKKIVPGYGARTGENPRSVWKKIQESIERDPLLGEFRELIDRIYNEMDREREGVKFKNYDDMSDDENLNPFGTMEGETPLLLQHLHDPQMMGLINSDLNINLREIPLSSQVHLLRYLSEAGNENFKRLQKILHDNPEVANDLLVSFLSYSQDKNFGECVVGFAEKFQNNGDVLRDIFREYGEMVENVDEESSGLENLTAVVFPGKTFKREKIKAAILRGASQILQRAESEISIKNSEEDSQKLIDELRAEKETKHKLLYELKESGQQLQTAREKIGLVTDKNKRGLVVYEQAFEKKFFNLMYGVESAELPREFFVDLESQIEQAKPETNLPATQPLYLPVGISKEMLKWQKVFEGKMEVAKPVDMYSYLFWLENQGKPATLVVCDEIQVSNYTQLYGVDEAEAVEAAQKIGRAEADWYRAVIERFGLKNIQVVDYRAFKENKNEKIEFYKNVINRLAQMPILRELILSMVQSSVGEQTGEADREKFLSYAVEEVVWILATAGTKVSHLNEARYDVVAAVIKNMERYLELGGGEKSLLDVDEQKLEAIAKGTAMALRDALQEKKRKIGNSNKSFSEYLDKAASHLGLMKETVRSKKEGEVENTASSAGVKKVLQKNTQFDFFVPTAGARSFGWRSKGENTEEVLKFKEPYSTYFYSDGSELFLDSDQVVADPGGNIGGKVMTLDTNKQNSYAEAVLKPQLVQYFQVLEYAPPQYFMKVGKTAEDIKEECLGARSLVDVLRFMQKYIIAPSTRGKEEKEVKSVAA